MPSPAISVTELEKYFPPALTGWRALTQPVARATEKALAGVSFDVKENESVALIGSNGAGKSTLLRILATLIIPTRGQATLGGFDVEREPAEARRLFGYHTGGDEGFYARLSARENLAFFAAMNNLSRADTRKRIEAVAELHGHPERFEPPSPDIFHRDDASSGLGASFAAPAGYFAAR